MKSLFKFIGCLTMLLFISISCSSLSKTTETSSWKDPAYQGGKVKSVIVIGIAQKDENSKLFEDTFVSELGNMGVEAVSGISLWGASKKLDADFIKGEAMKRGADSVILTYVEGIKEKLEYNPADPTDAILFSSQHQSMMLDYRSQDYTSYEYASLVTNVYNVDTKKKIWAYASDTLLSASVNRTIDSVIKSVLKKLKADGII